MPKMPKLPRKTFDKAAKPQTAAALETQEDTWRGKSVEADARLAVFVPGRVMREIQIERGEEGLTERQIVLKALKLYGFSVTEEDLVDRRFKANAANAAKRKQGEPKP
jgi:hypothetical protein